MEFNWRYKTELITEVLFILLEISLDYNILQGKKRMNKNGKEICLKAGKCICKQKIEEESEECKENLDNITPLKPEQERCFRGTGAKA